MSKKQKPIRIQECSCCGAKFWPLPFEDSPVTRKMAEKGLCFDCANWEILIDNPKRHGEIIEGVYYEFLPMQKKKAGVFLGGGRTKCILKKDLTTKKSNDVWKVGEIPARYRDRLQDTAWWISYSLYTKLQNRWFWCKTKKCRDRYHCLRFDVRREYTEEGPLNRPPLDWKVGDEKCPAFLNILDIRCYDGYEPVEDTI